MILLIILKQNETRPDAVPNTAIYTYGSGNRLLSDASATTTNTYAYDGAGRLTNHVVNGQTRTFAYNFQGRMTSLTDIDDNTFAYEFDGEGNRLSQSLNDCLSKRFVYDGADVLLELNPTNGVAYAWVNGPGIDQPIERLLYIDGAPRARRVFHSDALGSVAALTGPGGHVTQTYAYTAFGTLRSSSGPDLNRVTDTAREQLGDSQGWMYYRYRTYIPSCGRFISEDPLGFIDGPQRFVYVLNMPMRLRDAWGLEVSATYDLSTGQFSIQDEDEKITIQAEAESGGKPYGEPIPKGKYDILYRGRLGFYRLEPCDEPYGDDTHNETGRDNLRLHRPGLTIGCIAIKESEDWAKIEGLIEKTRTSEATVDSKSRLRWFGPKTEKLMKYGTLEVIESQGNQ